MKNILKEFTHVLAVMGLTIMAIILATTIIMLTVTLYRLVTQDAQLVIMSISGLILLVWGVWSVKYFKDKGDL